MKFYALPDDLRRALMEYLSGQPYAAVKDGMQALEQLQELQENERNRPRVVEN